jgi:preprotein translocase subunit SecD
VQVGARLLLVVALCVLAGCGGDSDGGTACRDGDADSVTVFAATSPSGGQAPPEAVDEAVRVICDRAEARDLKVDVRRQGADRVAIGLEPDKRQELDELTAPAQLVFYDWEPNVFGSPDQPLDDFDEAAKRAARVKPRAEPTDVPGDRANDLAVPPRPGTDLPRGIAIVKAEPPTEATADTPEQFFVIEDDAEMSGADIRDPEQNLDQQTQEPIVTMDFTERGRQAFARVTKRIAERGQESLPQPGQSPEMRFQRFAIVLDGQIVSLATIDFIANPEGIDGSSGAQINGIGSIEETKDLAENLRLGALPVRLERAR